MVSYEEQIWKDLEKILNENKCESKCESNLCKHLKKFIDNKEKSEICQDCGVVFFTSIFEIAEWNTYKNEDGSYQASVQRADFNHSDNPYDIPGTIPGINKNSLMMRIHYQQTFSHKQKTFWKTTEKLESYCNTLNLNPRIIPTAKIMWHTCMESGKLTRASVRMGLISACLYYACIHNNCSVDRHDIISKTDGNQKGFLKGEKIFLEIMEKVNAYSHLGKETINIKENDAFFKFCSDLGLPFNAHQVCNDIYTKYLDKLDSVSPKSITAGILFYVVKYKLELKQPSKSKISQVVKVCIPTINKVVSLILENLIL